MLKFLFRSSLILIVLIQIADTEMLSIIWLVQGCRFSWLNSLSAGLTTTVFNHLWFMTFRMVINHTCQQLTAPDVCNYYWLCLLSEDPEASHSSSIKLEMWGLIVDCIQKMDEVIVITHWVVKRWWLKMSVLFLLLPSWYFEKSGHHRPTIAILWLTSHEPKRKLHVVFLVWLKISRLCSQA